MGDRTEFTQKLSAAIAERSKYFNGECLPKLLENFKLLHTCARNVYDTLVKRSLIVADPYREDSNIKKIEAPSEENYPETESGVVIGTRYSQYEGMLEFICTRFGFSTENFTLQRIKRINELLASFTWNNMSTMSAQVNTRGLASLIHDARKSLDSLSGSLFTDSLTKASSAQSEIIAAMKELTTFKREEYKWFVRTDVCGKDFSYDGLSDVNDEVLAIKRAIAKRPTKMPSYTELINEIANEDIAGNRDTLQDTVLKRLVTKAKKKVEKKEAVNTKLLIVDSARAMTIAARTYKEIVDKLINNRDVLEDSKRTFIDKVKSALRKSFKIKEKPLIYRFIIEDKDKGAKRSRDVNINAFINNINKKAVLLGAIANPESSEFRKIQNAPEDVILTFVNRQITENKEILTLLIAADEYFKANVAKDARSKIKGLKIDLVTVNNAIVKTNKRRGEYLGAVEEAKSNKALQSKSSGAPQTAAPAAPAQSGGKTAAPANKKPAPTASKK